MKGASNMDALVSRMGSMHIADTTMDSGSDSPSIRHRRRTPIQPFPFFDLPSELRLRIYELVLILPKTIDLDSTNYRTILPLLSLFLVSHRMHAEASAVFYSTNAFRIFPIHGRFFHTKKPLLARLPPHYRTHITKLELRLGPGWTKPPRGWTVDARLHLEDVINTRLLKVFVECDPASDPVFEGFRVADDFYTGFCVELVRGLFEAVPSLRDVEFDAYPGITKTSPLLQALVGEAKGRGKRILWGPEREWDKIVEVNLMGALEALSLLGRD